MPFQREIARDIFRQLPFPADIPLNPEMLIPANPDYALFRNIKIIHPLVWGKLDLEPSTNMHIIAFMGPSSGGRDTILRDLQIPFAQILTYTTRTDRGDPSLADKYIFVRSEEFAEADKNHEFIEWVPQISGLYGTTIKETEKAILMGNQIIIWSCEESGPPKMWEWLAEKHPEIQRHIVFVLPQMSFIELANRIIKKRDVTQTDGRIQKARDEIIHAGTVADFLILNPPQEGGPIDATKAAEKLFTYFLMH